MKPCDENDSLAFAIEKIEKTIATDAAQMFYIHVIGAKMKLRKPKANNTEIGKECRKGRRRR
jgi:hypothetical protein